MATVTISGILEKIQSKDKDFRYMATSDLQNELAKDSFRVDESVEKRLCTAIMQQLEDLSGDISALAVKCLGLLVRKVGEPSSDMLVTSLGTKLTTGKNEQERDIASIGLKTVVAEVPTGIAKSVVKRVTPTLISGLSATEVDVVNASLEILNDLLNKFGGLMAGDHARLRDSLLPLLEDNRAGVKKRAIHCLGALAPYLKDNLLAATVELILAKLESKSLTADASLVYVQAVGTLSRSTGWRFGAFLDRAVSLIIAYCQSAKEGDDELQEACLQALDAFVLRSPHEAQPHVAAIFEHVQGCLAYDPNYADDMDAEDMDEEAEDDDELSDEGYSDDEDTSWKVRRAAAKCLSAVITEYPNLLQDIYAKASQSLIGRLREREENVKLDIFNSFVDLIRQVGVASRLGGPSAGPVVQLRADVPAILRAASRQLRDKSVKTKAGIFQVLKELVAVLPDATAADIDQLVPGILNALNDKSSSASALKIQALQFLGLALHGASSLEWQHQIGRLAPPIFSAVGDRYYKVSAEAIRVCEELVHAIRPSPPAPLQPALQGLVAPLFQAIRPKLAAQDQDQEVKEAAISCTATAVASLGDVPGAEYLSQVKVLLDRMKNDITRLPAVKAFTKVAQSPLQLSLAPHVQALLPELISFLRKANRPLRQASLAAIDAVLMHKESAQGLPTGEIVDAVPGLISDSDLLLTGASLHVAGTLLRCHPSTAGSVSQKLLPPAVDLAQSPLLQGSALEALKAFFIALLQSRMPAVSFESLLNSLLAAGNVEDTGKAAQASIAQCIAALCQSAGPQKTATTVQSLLAVLQSRSGQPAAKHLALLSIGEVGRTTDLSAFPHLQQTLTAALASSEEDLKTAASQALGAVCVGNLAAYLPFVLQQIQEQAANPKDQYLLLRALNEVIMSLAASSTGGQLLAPNYQSEVLGLLLQSCDSEEECRNVVAECLGHLALLAPPQVVPVLQQRAGAGSAPMRATVVMAVKHTIVDQPHAVDGLLVTSLPTFLALLSDPDRHVRKAAVQLLSIAAHNKADLVREQLPGLLPRLYQQTVTDEALIRTVDLGPFKHKIDDGLELRKAAFECMDVLLDKASDRLYLPDFIRHLQSGIEDHYDVKMPCHLLLSKLAVKAGGQVLAALDPLSKSLEMTLTTKLKSDAVQQEKDRNDDMLRSCLRAIDACSRIPNVETSTGFKHLMDNVVLQPPIAPKYRAVKEERAEAEGRDAIEL